MDEPPERPHEEVAGLPDDPLPPLGGEAETPPAPPPPPVQRKFPAPVMTLGLVAANVGVHLLVAWYAEVSPFHSSFTGRGSQEEGFAWQKALELLGWKENERILAGEYWRLITAAFLHGGILHLGGNMIGLWNLGQFVEMMYGARRFLFIYVASAVAGSVGSTLGTDLPSVGASGAIFGLLGCGLVFSIRHRKAVPRGLGASLFRQLFFWAVLLLGFGFIFPVIDNAGHIGGLVGGFAVAFLVSPRMAPPRRPAIESNVAVTGFILSLAVLLIGGFFMGKRVSGDRSDLPPMERYDGQADYSILIPKGWKWVTAGPNFVQFIDEAAETPFIVKIAGGGEAFPLGDPDAFARRVADEMGNPEVAATPEEIRHRVGKGFRVEVEVNRSEILRETRYYLVRGGGVLTLIFRDARVPPGIRKAMVDSLRWRE